MDLCFFDLFAQSFSGKQIRPRSFILNDTRGCLVFPFSFFSLHLAISWRANFSHEPRNLFQGDSFALQNVAYTHAAAFMGQIYVNDYLFLGNDLRYLSRYSPIFSIGMRLKPSFQAGESSLSWKFSFSKSTKPGSISITRLLLFLFLFIDFYYSMKRCRPIIYPVTMHPYIIRFSPAVRAVTFVLKPSIMLS